MENIGYKCFYVILTVKLILSSDRRKMPMSAIEDAIVLLSSKEPAKNFGTVFIIAQDHAHRYLLICAHVIEQINPDNSVNHLKILGLDEAVEIISQGSGSGIDIALLKVAGLLDSISDISKS